MKVGEGLSLSSEICGKINEEQEDYSGPPNMVTARGNTHKSNWVSQLYNLKKKKKNK